MLIRRCGWVLALLCVTGLAHAQMLVPRYAHTATALTDGRVLVYGGLGPGDSFIIGSEIISADGSESVFGPRGHKARAFHTATRLRDGSVLLAGGFVLPYSTSRTAELYDGRAILFLPHHMSAPRELHSATLLEDGRVLITGGFVGGVTSLASCDLYDPERRAFDPTGTLAEERFGHAACLLPDGRVLVTGGSQFPGERVLRSAEVYDPATGQFAPAGEMLSDRSRHTMTLLGDGRVLITGGYSASAKIQLASTELFDPGSGSSEPGPEMSDARMDHTATLLADGRVLVTGGFNAVGGPHTVGSCEIFDLETCSFTRAAGLPAPVHEHKAALLPGGVLITGGLHVEPDRRTTLDLTVVIPTR